MKSTIANIPYPSVVAALVLIDELELPCAYGSIEIETIPLLDSSMAMLDNVSLDLWKPGIIITAGAGDILVALDGLYKSATTHCPFWVGIFIVWILTEPNEDCTKDAKKDEKKITDKHTQNFFIAKSKKKNVLFLSY